MNEKPPRKKTAKKPAKKRSSRSSSPQSPKSKKSEDSLPRVAPSAPATSPPNICPAHSKPFTLFSDTTERLLCESCREPPQQGAQPRLLPLEEAFRYKLSTMYNSVNTHLFAKREALHLQLRRFQLALQELKQANLAIERDLKNEFSAMNERLNSASGTKLAVLEHQLHELRTDVDRVTLVAGAVDNSDMLGFLRRARELRDALEIAMVKPFRTDIAVTAEDLPVELSHIRQVGQEYPALCNLIHFKDQLIWNIVHGNRPRKQVKDSYQSELAEWARLTDRMEQELNRFQMTCDHCGAQLNEETVNALCTEGECHFFSRGKRRMDKNPKTLKKLGKILKKLNTDMKTALVTKDTEKLGTLSPTEFYSAMSSLGLKGKIINKLVTSYGVSHGRIDYHALLRDAGENTWNKEIILGYCRQVDVKNEGLVPLRNLREILERAGGEMESIEQTMRTAEQDGQGNVLYDNFVNCLR